MQKNSLLAIVSLGSLALFGWGCTDRSTVTPEPQQPAQEVPASETGSNIQLEQQAEAPATDTAQEAPTEAAAKPSAPVKTNTVITSPKTTTTKPPENKATVNAVSITASAFSPQVIAGKEGDTIRWVNNDAKPHTTVSDGSLLWDSGSLQPGASYSRVFKAAGTYPYHDGSTGMKGTVVIR